MYVIDASVHVADARPQEPHHAEARTLLARLAEDKQAVYLPEIVLAEVAAAVVRGTGNSPLAERLVAALRRVPHFQFIPVDSELGDLAAQVAAQCRLRGCDAVYAALAQQKNVPLITLDHQQRQRVPQGVNAQTPAEALADLEPRAR